MNLYRMECKTNEYHKTTWTLQKRYYLFFWKTILKGSLEEVFSEKERLELIDALTNK